MAAPQGAAAAAAAGQQAASAAGSNMRLFVQALLELCRPDSAQVQEAVAAAAASAQLTAGAADGSSSSQAAPQCHPAWCAFFRHRMREFIAAMLLLLRCMPLPAVRLQGLQDSWAALAELHDIVCLVSKQLQFTISAFFRPVAFVPAEGAL